MGKDLFNDRISRFSIRKLNVGVCSVLLGTLVMVGTAASAAAEEKTDTTNESVAAVATASEAPEASTATATSATSTAPATSTYDASPAVTAAPATSTAVASTSAASSASTAASAASTAPATSTGSETPSLEVATPANKAAEVTSTSADKKETPTLSAGQGLPTNNTLATEETAQTSGKRRSRRSIGDPNDPNLIGDDVQDATSTPKEAKPGFTTNIKATDLASQISWLDFGDTASWTGTTTTSSGNLALQVGSTYTKEIMPGYVVTIKVKSLKPFQATEIYKKRLEERGATEAEKATYDPNAKNGYIGTTTSAATNKAFNNGEEAKIIAEAQNRWTEIKGEGIDTGTKKTTISSEFDGGNIGVQFEISATFRGKAVKPAVVMADGESANPGESVIFTTNGEGWQQIGEWYKYGRRSTKTFIPQDTDNLFGPNPTFNIEGTNYYSTNLNLLKRANEVGPDKKAVAWKYFGSADLTTGGLGTGVFGPNISAGPSAVPLVMTKGASEVGLYIASSGKQSAMLGFFPLDEGDAPASYGKAIHSIATVDGVTGKKVNQPYLGHLSPDMDENNTLDWTGDDKATTADEGIDQLLPNDLKGKTNELIKMDRTRPGNYTISVEAHTDGAAKANIYGWVDFNQNGTFDEDERSDLTTITQDGTATLRFTKSKTYIDPSVNELGVRVRIAKDADQIESPTGMAFSGEVEDFKTQITHPPKGEFKETTGPQGAKQTATVAFTARGLQGYSLTESAKIDETVAPQMIDNRTGQVVTPGADGYYAVAGQGKYKITSNGTSVDVEFIPEDHFLGTADGISIRRTDSNGYDTGWSTKFPADEANVDTAINTMDGLYIPTVTPTEIEGVDKTSSDVQGATQTGTPTFNTTTTNANGEKISVTPSLEYPAKLVDPATGQVTNATSVTVAGEGTYSIDDATGKVTFVPEPGFTGTAQGVTVSVTAPVGKDKDGTVRDEYLKTATAKYTPTVTPITVTPTDKVSADIQNVPQTQTPTFDLSNDKTAEITSKKLVDPATGQPTDETTVTVAGEGSYTIDPTTGAVTFTPEKDFVGTAKGVTVQATATITNANGKTATITSDATYTPTVVPAVPTANPATSKDVQGATQTGTPTFAGTTVQVNGEDKAITIKDNSYTLLDKDGNEVSTTPAYAADGTTVIGNFTIDPATGQVTFTPTDKSYTGAVTPAKVQAESSNGIKVDTTYTPEIVPVTPTATPTETTDIQGATQTGKPEFKGGTVTVDGVEKTVEINEDVPASFDDGSTTKTVEGVGTYTVAADGTVTFVPEKSFFGTAPAVTVVREDKNGTKASATYTPTVLPVTPTATPAETTDIQGATQKGKPEFKGGTVTVDGVEKTVEINEDVPATFDDGSTTKTVDGVGTYTVAADGTVTFVPEKSFTGKAPAVTVVREDKNGTKASATYTPTVTPVTPTATPVETTGKQGQTQTGKPEFTEGDSRVPINEDVPATFDDGSTTKTVDGVGTYTVAADGTVTFVPEKSFTGKAPAVTVVREDKNGTKASATYTPTVTPVTPTATPAESTGPQGLVQTGTVTFTEGDEVAPIDKNTITLLDENGQPAASVEAKSPAGDVIGTYTVDKDTGVVTFTPTDKSYSGDVVPVKVQAADTNGTTVETTYTPKITPVVPTSEDATSTDIQGQTQSGKPTFTEGNPNVPIDEDTPATFEDGSTTKTVDGEGTYTVAPDGTITFVPEKSFTGTATGVTVKRVDKNGTEITAKYTPTVTPVTPTATPVETTDIQGATQTGKPVFTEGDSRVPMNDDVPATFDDGSTTKTVDGVGTYTVAADGTVTFVPEKSFVGTAPAVTVVREDKNGTKASATYTPTVTPVTPTAEDTTSTDKQGQKQTGTPTFTPGNPNVPMDDDTPATFEDGSTTKTVPGEGTYTVAPDGTVTFVPEKSFTGEGTGVTVKRVDKNGTPVTAKYTPTVTPVTPTATPAESEAPQGVVQTGTVTFTEGNPVAPIDKDTITLLDENGQPAESVVAKSPEGKEIGTFTVDKATGLVTFTPTDKSYSGDVVPVKVQGKDTNGTVAETTYTPKITPVVPTAEPATSTDIQGKTQTGTPSFTPGNPAIPMDDDVPATFEDGSTTKTIPGEGTYTVAPDGTVTFVPEKSFTGTGTGVTVKRVDKNGTPVTATYTPTVTPVTPTAEPATSTDKQGQTQTGKPTFTAGHENVPVNDAVPATFEDGSTTKEILGVGIYTVAADGTVTFKPDPRFVGEAPAVTVVREDMNGTKASATYTPTVTPITPTAEPAKSEAPQGIVQTGKPTFTEGDPIAPMNPSTLKLYDDSGNPTDQLDAFSPAGDIIGIFTVDKEKGEVIFTPTNKAYSGEVLPVGVSMEDANGTFARTTYTPFITPVVPTAEPATSTDIQGATQTGKPTFTEGNPAVPMDNDVPATFVDGSTTKVVPGEGTYTVAPDGTVTFVPEKSFVGTAAGIVVQRQDKNGTVVKAMYTPTVTPVTPTGTPAVSTDVQGATQTGKPSFTEGDSRVPMNDKVPATFDDGSTTKTVEGVGTYTVAPDGTVTFVPEKSFVGTAPAVTVVREDVNGTKASATYTPTVTPVTPAADPATSTDIQGQTQTGKPTFTPGNPSVPMDDEVPATFEDGSTTKVIPGEGTYTVAPDGTVTFVPEKSFTGTGTGVTVKRVDKNGTVVKAKYTPTVTPVVPTAEPVTSIGKKGQTQTGKPSFTEGDSRVPMNDQVPANFEDGSTTKTIPGVGTYTVAADGTVTFTPEPEFTGTAPAVTVVREDVNGTKASATYTPTVLPITKFVDKEGKEIPGYPTVDGEEPKAEIPGYRFVETKKLPNGDTEHVYEKVTTSYVDENGDPIPGNPTEDGEQPKKDIPGYDFVKTVVDKDGNIQHIYKKTVTPTPTPDPTPTPEPQPQPTPQPIPQPKPEEPTIPVVPETKEEVKYIDPQNPTAQLPNTGTKESSTAGLAIFSALAGLSLFGFAKRKKED
ncbi:MAG: CshA/CshB family fibrillar adhesin-related protein [Streptococcus parasanguinis]|nr:CshA/CshB family fibrillar adhesin-related protein [Streptococcus parasanguinis]MDU5844030.1 CshA/CshB family fibrillar adhesin-related protein [Streptococcus parasanguinis]